MIRISNSEDCQRGSYLSRRSRGVCRTTYADPLVSSLPWPGAEGDTEVAELGTSGHPFVASAVARVPSGVASARGAGRDPWRDHLPFR